METNDGREPMTGERKDRVASRMDEAGSRMKERAEVMESRGGVQRRAGQAVRRAGDLAERGASYLRTHEVGEIRSDMEVRVRERPLVSVGIALGAGYLLGRLLG